jgi:predicted nucleotidyltransferase
MHPAITEHMAALTELCRRHHVVRLEIFGSAARGDDFAPSRSDADFLVTFEPAYRNDIALFEDLQDALEALLGRRVDLVERRAVEANRNHIRKARILAEAQPVYG